MAAKQAGRVRVMGTDDLELVLNWRNHPDIRSCMYSQDEIRLENHKRWFESASTNPNKHLLIYEREGIPLGYICLDRLSLGPVADWGFYAAPDAPKGTGSALGNAALAYAFNEAGFHKVCGQVIEYNARSVHFHKKLGFKAEGVLRDQFFDGELFHNILCFGILQHEWQENLE